MSLVANSNDPAVLFFIKGRNQMADRTGEFHVRIDKTIEITDTIVDSDGERVFPVNQDLVDLLVASIEAEDPETTVRVILTLDDGMNPPQDLVLYMNRLLLFEIGTGMKDLISQVKILTTSALPVKVRIGLHSYVTGP